jgi:uncharacterized protein YdhG (YjbR/CyaY superfamily)
MHGRTTVSSRNPAVDDYMDKLALERRAALAVVRSLVFETVPDAVESMRYRMPTYEFENGVLCALASQKHYMSLYMDAELVEKHGEELAGLDVGKSCIRFRKLEKLPLDTVTAILRETVQRINAD